MAYIDMSVPELTELKVQLEDEFAQFKLRDLKLNMARGKPSSEQLDLSEGMLTLFRSSSDFISEEGTDCRN